jgi:hypothetical protein
LHGGKIRPIFGRREIRQFTLPKAGQPAAYLSTSGKYNSIMYTERSDALSLRCTELVEVSTCSIPQTLKYSILLPSERKKLPEGLPNISHNVLLKNIILLPSFEQTRILLVFISETYN